ncbi:hypothetical protein [Deefgea salmonis]|uniref:Uncharacterized protein n=1 Tax=Deefgea salmonis TaxID=2875502 RepID=A0ABS8BJ14_9NEIS|nr:hypothetical protein [Deefgea salmonis]MCB5195710.1 hypothetical protein [Deefgea salmonis]
MSPLEAKEIIESLANGIDPDTGEILTKQSIINRRLVKKAFSVAIESLEKAVKRVERENSLPENAGSSWSEEEEETIISDYESGVSIKEIAAKVGRSKGAISSRLARLGMI